MEKPKLLPQRSLVPAGRLAFYSKSPRALFVCHDASRTGAPIWLLNLLRYFKAHSIIEFDTLLIGGGELEAEFYDIGRVFRLENGPTAKHYLQPLAPSVYASCKMQEMIVELLSRNIKLIYANTSVVGLAIKALAPLNARLISHIHELDFALKYYCPTGSLAYLKEFSHKIIAASNAVKQNLIVNYSFDPSKIRVIHSTVPETNPNFKFEEARAITRGNLGLQDSDFLVSACGSPDWRKGFDLFIQVAGQLVSASTSGRKLRLAWVGCDRASIAWGQAQHDAHRNDSWEMLFLIPKVHNVEFYLAASDLFLLTSREDAFPLVMLEAGLGKCATVGFRDSGGSSEFVSKGLGELVPFLDIAALAKAILARFESPEIAKAEGDRANVVVHEKFLVNHGAKLIFDTIQEVLSVE